MGRLRRQNGYWKAPVASHAPHSATRPVRRTGPTFQTQFSELFVRWSSRNHDHCFASESRATDAPVGPYGNERPVFILPIAAADPASTLVAIVGRRIPDETSGGDGRHYSIATS